MPNKNSEITALNNVNEALEDLNEEERLRVINWAIQKYGIKVNGQNGSTITKINPASGLNGKDIINQDIEIKDFLNQKNPKDTYQRIACLAYYMDKFESKPEFKTAQLTDANTRARQNKVSNMSVYVADTTRAYGYLTPTKKGNKSLTTRGEGMVERLPDHEAVDNYLKEHPFRRKGTKSKNRKTKSK